MSRADVYERVTRTIMERLEAGVAPWHKPWGVHGRPRNFVSGRPYSGINALNLGLSGRGPYWLTMNQVNRMGFRVRKGSKGTPVLYAKRTEVEERDESGETVTRTRFLMRFYFVFNVEDVDGLVVPTTPTPAAEGLASAEAILAQVKPEPRIERGPQACFIPDLDVIRLPPRESFESPEAYYGTLFHELTHWSGHASRLNRETVTQAAPFGSPVYSQEELVAEMGAGFLCTLAGIENATIDQSASYIASWLKVLRNEPGLTVRAAAQAQKAVDFLAPPDTQLSPSMAASEADGESEVVA